MTGKNATSKRRWSFRRFRRDERAAAAVEFGIVAVPFFAMLFAIIEVGLSFFTSQILETAVNDASRMIMTGTAQTTGMTQVQFAQQVCNRLPSMFDCIANLQIDVRTTANFNVADVSKPIVNGNIAWTPQYNPGNPGQIVIVRAAYTIPVFVNILGASMANLNNGKVLLLATSAFRNEPYQ
jgi:Flp pilus assembly protein TadG